MTSCFRAWQSQPKTQLALVLLLAAAVVLANINQPYPQIAPLQHIPTVLLILATPPLLRRFPLSDGAVGALTAFFLLHTLAGRYTYSNVPYDAWARTVFGHDISSTFGLQRNGFDRVVHASFGLLWIAPFAQAVQRHAALLWGCAACRGHPRRMGGACHVRPACVAAFDQAAQRHGPVDGRGHRHLRPAADHPVHDQGPPHWVPASVALYITAAYWFTSSTSFANPAITIARALSDTFAGIAPASVPGFIAAQFVGAMAAHICADTLYPAKDIA